MSRGVSSSPQVGRLSPAPAQVLADLRPGFDPGARQQRQVKELEDYTQKLLREAERTRAESS